jgi:hypothetical protein
MELDKKIQFGILVLEVPKRLVVEQAHLIHIGLTSGWVGEFDVGAGIVGAEVKNLLYSST